MNNTRIMSTNLHKLGEARHGEHFVDFRADVDDLELALELHHGTHGLLNDTEAGAGHIDELIAVHDEVYTTVFQCGLDVFFKLIGVHCVNTCSCLNDGLTTFF